MFEEKSPRLSAHLTPTNVALHLHEESLRKIVDTAVDSIIIIDARGAIQTFNLASEKIFGFQTNEVIGRNVNILMPEPDNAEHDDYLSRYLETGEAHIIGIGRVAEGRRKDGSIFPIELAVSEIEIDGEIMFTGIIRDITERKQIEQELIIAKDEAHRANQAKSEFLNSMSHELRTPLNAIMGFTQLMQMDVDQPLNKNHLESLKEIHAGGQHLLELINDVLDLARIESGQVSLSLEPVDVNAVLSETLSMILPLAQKRNIQIIDKRDKSKHLVVRGSVRSVREVLLNILSNAVKYNNDGGEIIISAEETPESMLRLSISDTGSGISEAQLDTVFEPFNRLSASEEIEGTGIGMSISKHLTELMNGHIGVTSRVGYGSTFFIELPLYLESINQ